MAHTRDELEAMTRKDLIAMLPEGHGFNPVSTKKAEIIDRLLARKTQAVVELTEREEALVRLVTPDAPADASDAETALHEALAHIRLVLVDPFGQRFVINPEGETEVVVRGFPEPTGIDEWQWFTKPLLIGDKEYDVVNPNGIIAR